MLSDEAFAIPDGWPAMSLGEVREALTAPGARFEMDTVDIEGRPTKVWVNTPPNYAALATAAAEVHGERLFMIYEDERITYDAWFRATSALAHELQAMGVGKGDRVALAMRNLPEWPVAFFAATAIGAILVPLNAWWTGAELEYGLRDSGAKVLICDAERLERIAGHREGLDRLEHIFVCRCETDPGEGVRRLEDTLGSTPIDWTPIKRRPLPEIDIAPDDDGTIFYTSGTTGHPKGAIGSHRNILTCILSGGYSQARTLLRRGETPPATPEPKTMLCVIPLFHVTACCAVLMGTMAAGSTLVFMHKWDATKALEIIEKERVNATGGVPTIAWQLLEHPDRDKYDLSSLETISYGGAPSAPELVRKIREVFGALPGNGWGMTETSATVTTHSSEDYLNRPESCGPPVPVAEIKVMSEDGSRELGVGEVGELWAFGPMVVRGYWNKPEATAETFTDGWIRTGDLARIDEEGFCYIVDRAKDMVIRGGENIYSSEVENVLYDHPAVTDAALIGLPHKTLGEQPAAVVHLAPGESASEAELQAWVRERLAAFKVPVRIAFVEETLPRNANGKIMKRDLAKLFFDAEEEAA